MCYTVYSYNTCSIKYKKQKDEIVYIIIFIILLCRWYACYCVIVKLSNTHTIYIYIRVYMQQNLSTNDVNSLPISMDDSPPALQATTNLSPTV